MLTSLALILLLGLLLGSVFQKLKLPGLLGMLLTGVLLGPYVLNLLDERILMISSDLRRLALVIILMRAGLSLNIKDLKKVGRPAILLCFVPSCLEILGFLLLAPGILHISVIEAALMGSVVAAVSPAVVIPRMLKLIEEKYGTKNSIPGLMLAGASVDDVFVIILFTAFTSLAAGNSVSAADFIQVPVSILTGTTVGLLTGILLSKFFQSFHLRDTVKVILMLGISFLLLELENRLSGILPLSGLLAVVSMSAAIYQTYSVLAKRLSVKFNKIWIAAELLVFVLIGASVDLKYVLSAGAVSALVIFGALLFRMAGVFLSFAKTKLTMKERIFCMLSYTPKASVQAAIGTVPLSMGLACGDKVLTAAVLSILLTAPLGALAMDLSYKKLLSREDI